MPTPTKVSVRAIAVGLVMFPVVYVVGTLLGNMLIRHPEGAPGAYLYMASILAVLFWLLPGFTTGYIAKQSPLTHGLLLGAGSILLTLLVIAILEFVLRFSDSLPMSLIVGLLVPVFLGSCIGAFIGQYFANRRHAP